MHDTETNRLDSSPTTGTNVFNGLERDHQASNKCKGQQNKKRAR
jgi:hypothetical protein